VWRSWRTTRYVLAAITFIATLLNPGAVFDGPPIVQAVAAAITVWVAVWLYEAIFNAARWVWRRLTT
jgi:hypothetical protein